MELTIENLRTLASGGQIFLTAHSQARLYERGILLADIRQAIQSGKIIEYRPDDYRCPSCLVLGVNLAGRWLHVVCGIHEGALWILTAYWPDLDHWNATYTGNDYDLLFLQRRNEAQHDYSHGSAEELCCGHQECALPEVRTVRRGRSVS